MSSRVEGGAGVCLAIGLAVGCTGALDAKPAATGAGTGPTPSTPVGASWSEVPVPAALGGLEVTDAWVAGPDDIFFAAADPAVNGGNASGTRRVLRWSNGSWTDV